MEEDYWLINSNRSKVKRFSKNKQNKDKFFEYMFIESGRNLSVLLKEPPLMTNREKLKIYKVNPSINLNKVYVLSIGAIVNPLRTSCS